MTLLLAAGTLACQAPAVQSISGAGGGGGKPGATGGQGGGTNPQGMPPQAFPDGGAPSTTNPGGMECAREVHAAERVPVDLVLLVDASGSMDQASGTQTKWQRSREALGAFVRDPASAGLGVGMTFFPGDPPDQMRECARDDDCAGLSEPVAGSCRTSGYCFAPGVPLLTNRTCSTGAIINIFNCPAGMMCKARGQCAQSGAPCVQGSTCPGGAADKCETTAGRCRPRDEGCEVSQFGKLDVDIGDLPGRAGAITAALMARMPDGATPMTRAVDSALTALAARQMSQPQRRSVLVLATDGQPSGCGDTQNVDTVAARLEQGARMPTPILTYVVGVFSPAEIAEAQPALERFAAAGGTMSPFILATGDDLTQKLLDALKAIRGLSVACEYSIPQPATGSIDFGKVNVRTTSQAGPDEPGHVTSADRCSAQGGWYYDPPPTAGDPKRLILCPATCARLRADPSARVDLVFGCATVVIK
jgi:hypothetical protein